MTCPSRSRDPVQREDPVMSAADIESASRGEHRGNERGPSQSGPVLPGMGTRVKSHVSFLELTSW